jgi:hypothetical protein
MLHQESPYLTSDDGSGQSESNPAAKLLSMEPNSFGRRLGIGVRVAGKMLRQRAAASSRPAGFAPAARPAQATPGGSRPAGAGSRRVQPKDFAEPARRVAQGTRRFGQAFWGPLAHTGATLWLEITGLFFALFALFFAQNVIRVRSDYAHGPEHTHFILYLMLMLAFCWFCFTSFHEAYKRGKRKAGR